MLNIVSNQKPLKDFIERIIIRNKDQSAPVYSVTKSGLVPQQERFGKQISSSNVSKYLCVPPNHFTYNPMTTNGVDIAVCFNNSNHTVCVSSQCIVFKSKEESINFYLEAFFSSSYFFHQANQNICPRVILNLSWEDFETIMLPTNNLEKKNNLCLFLRKKEKILNTKIQKIKQLLKFF
ncbi:hypothetical protein [Candidatus Phytoplasma meliae]|uniref:Type I restriction modification DNA specificity domain-containing protein n=1 Tax=Candidatus Phytoplasma meliae TaxID=1848402 RepID=A0ABS5CXR2_9MOLU|nr:hypothetical protein [Candidatus Phytoplasma meliae]MBP5835763.1 hypothetical protein [Candidatus Phytoplasma meliae]